LKSAGLVIGATAFGLPGACLAGDDEEGALAVPFTREDVFPAKRSADYAGKGVELTPRLAAATHNNFYEFLPGRGGPVWKYTDDFKVKPWKVEVKGLVKKPMTLDLDDLFGFPHEERIYRFRCVETWAMDIPWTGFPLAALLKRVEPMSTAKHVRFVTAEEEEQMPGLRKQRGSYSWPYHEALRMAEAMNDLTMVVTGVYGHPLLKQHGAPVRIIAPWKYGYKSPKSVVTIELIEEQPLTFWSRKPYAHEYGYLSNVNPNIPHPRWSQETEYPLREGGATRSGPSRPTKIFNGYEEEVAKLYPKEPREPQKALASGQTAR
jgi:sulfoxide reductase catalytic subunit YedY